MHVVRIEQVTSTSPAEEDRSLHTPPISLVTDDYKPQSTQEISLTSTNQGQSIWFCGFLGSSFTSKKLFSYYTSV
jgi:hypothetical protein